MYEINFTTLGSSITSFFDIVGGILRFDSAAYRAVFSLDGGPVLGLVILILGGISLGLGQSVVLFANRVRRRRFVLRLLSSGLVLLLVVLLWAGSVWLLATIFLDGNVSYINVFTGAAISTAPLLFGFFVLLPYLGIFIFIILRIWALLIYLVVIDTATDTGYWWALGLSLSGWLLLELILRLPPLQYERVRNWYWRVTTGTPHRADIDEMVGRFMKELRSSIGSGEENVDRDKE